MESEFTILHKKYKNPIFSYVYYLSGDRCIAEEVCQEVFLKVYLNIEGFQGKSSFKTWIYRIAKNTYLDFARKSSNIEKDFEILDENYSALPYKLAEFGFGIFFSKNILPMGQRLDVRITGEMGFFPFDPVLEFLSTIISPAIIASFGMMALGFLLSDKRVFQKKKILRFLIGGISVFMVWIVVLHGMYIFTLNKIDKLEDIKDLTIFCVDKFSSSWVLAIDEKEDGQLIKEISGAEKIGKGLYPQEKEGFELFIGFGGGSRVPAYIEKNSNEMITMNGNRYRVSDGVVKRLTAIVGGVKGE